MEVENLHIKITTDSGTASQDISSAAKELEKLDTQSTTTAADLTQLETSLGRIASVTGQFVDSISASVSGLSEFNGKFESAAWSVSWLGSSSETTAAALSGVTAAADGFGDKMSILQGATDGTASGMGELQRQLTDTLSSIRGFSDNMSTAGQDAEAASRKIKELAEDIEKIKTSSVSGSQGVFTLAAGFKQLKGLVATLGIGAFIKSSNDAYNVQMQNELKLTAHMKHRMNATDEQIQSVKELASAQQRLGIIGDEIQLAGAQQLTTYARNASTLQTLIPAMNNLIAQNAGFEASTGDATSAADMLGRALNGQYTSLKRMGVTFTEAQENVLKYGTEEQKAAVLADAINSKVGNMNELLANTPTGRLKQLQNTFGDLKEQLGATFQPLIMTFVPIASKMLEILAPPVLAFSNGIAVVGQTLSQLDSPATRAIGLAIAGIYVVNKLKLAIGGTATGLLLLGAIAVGILGKMNESENAIGDIVTNAFGDAANATDDASNSAVNYNEQLKKTGETAKKLAGFDTITKLSGGSAGSLSLDLDTSNYEDELNTVTDAVSAAQEKLSGINLLPEIDWKTLGAKLYEFTSQAWDNLFTFGKEIATLVAGWGDDDKMYAPLKKWSNQIEDILNAVGLDGTEFVNFWMSIGDDIYKAMTGGDSSVLKGIEELDNAFKFMLGDFGREWSNFWKGAGAGLYELTHKDQIDAEKINSKYSTGAFNDYVVEALKKGYSADDAIAEAQSKYLTSSEAWYWYNSLLDGNTRTTALQAELWRNNLLQSGQIETYSLYDAVYSNDEAKRPNQSSTVDNLHRGGMPSYVDTKNITVINYIDGEQARSQNTIITNGGVG